MKKVYFYSLVLMLIGMLMASGAVYAQNNGPVSTVPTLGEWGMIGTAILLGIAGLYKIFRNR